MYYNCNMQTNILSFLRTKGRKWNGEFKLKKLDILNKKISKRKLGKYIKSPLNYTGNKFRILDQIIPQMPKQIDVMIDLFSGGATVGLNVDAKKVIFVDSNEKVVNLLKYIASYSNVDLLFEDIFDLIEEYGFSLSSVYGYSLYKSEIEGSNPNNGLKDYNAKSFLKLREDYNKLSNKNSNKSNLMLYILMVYGFNNDMRFSSVGNFNLPPGKTDFNLNNALKLKQFIERTNNIDYEFICDTFNSEKSKRLISTSDFVYMDPPYLITRAVYNESNKWTNLDEHELLKLIDTLLLQNKNFMLSNIMKKRDTYNEPLYYWSQGKSNEISIIDIDYHYRGASYNKKDRNGKEQEIIIVPRFLK